MGLDMIYPCTKFEVCSLTRSKDAGSAIVPKLYRHSVNLRRFLTDLYQI